MSIFYDTLPRKLFVSDGARLFSHVLEGEKCWSVAVTSINRGFACKLKICMHIFESSQLLACIKLAMTCFQMVL